jgi:hypothetical protein
MKKIYIYIATTGCFMPFLNNSAASVPAEMSERLSSSAPEKCITLWKADPHADYAVSMFKDGLPPYISAKTGAFWSQGDAEHARIIAQIIANETGEAIHNDRPIQNRSDGVWRVVHPQAK